MSFKINKELIFIDSYQFLSFLLVGSSVKNLGEHDFKYSSQ